MALRWRIEINGLERPKYSDDFKTVNVVKTLHS